MSAGGRVDAEMLRERRSSGTDDEDDDSSDESGHHAPIMSIFASYYGIEDTSAQEMKGTIDDANFNSEQYVKVRLLVDCCACFKIICIFFRICSQMIQWKD